jgi:hypothetical protein
VKASLGPRHAWFLGDAAASADGMLGWVARGRRPALGGQYWRRSCLAWLSIASQSGVSGRCCVVSPQGRLKANIHWDQIAKTSSSNAIAIRRLVGP